MKVKPFYISTAGLTEKEVGIAIDKCAKSGADAYEGVSTYHGDCDFHGGLMTFDVWRFFGVDESNGTVFEDDSEDFGSDAQEITLDQLDEWLGVNQTETPEEKEVLDMIDTTSKQVESLAKGDVTDWKAGDECVYKLHGALVVGWHPFHPVLVIDSDAFGLVSCTIDELSKPESPEQKAERERIEAAYDLYLTAFGDCHNKVNCFNDMNEATQSAWLAIVDKTGYRKAK